MKSKNSGYIFVFYKEVVSFAFMKVPTILSDHTMFHL